MRVVSNSGPLLSFARAGRLSLLRDAIGEIVIPEAVYEDIVVRGQGKPGSDAIREASWIIRQRVEDRSLVDQLPAKLHGGEREAIALARELGAALLVDEQEARKEAQRLGIAYFGSLRVLKEAKEKGIGNPVKPILDELVASGTYLRPTLYREFLREMGEEQGTHPAS